MPKKLPVVPVSYGEKFRVGRSEYKLFLNNFFHDLSGFEQTVQHTPFWHAMISPQPPRENRVA